jgi:hypothetical protein
MKTIINSFIYFILSIPLVCIIGSSCSSNSKINHKEQPQQIDDSTKVVQVDLKIEDTFQYDLGFFGDEDYARILKNSGMDAYSEFCSDNREPLIYCYSSRVKGRDTVSIKIGKGGNYKGEFENVTTFDFYFKIR